MPGGADLIPYSNYHSAVVELQRSAPFAAEYSIEDALEAAGASRHLRDSTASDAFVVVDTEPFSSAGSWALSTFVGTLPATQGWTVSTSVVERGLARLSAITHAVSSVLGSLSSGSTANSMPIAVSANWSRLSTSELPPRVFGDLLSAASSAKRVQGSQSPLSTKSLSAFLDLWHAVAELAREPVVSVTPKGYVVTEWFRDYENSLAVMVNANGDFVYSLSESGAEAEGVVQAGELEAFVNLMLGRAENPFLWSDA